MFLNKLILFVFFAFAIRISSAQNQILNVNHITGEDGLSDNQVTCILRDKLGFIWIGTKDGLNRFDGRGFYVFRHIENDPTSLCGNNITCLAVDDDSLLWIGTATAGFCSYDFRIGKFKSYNKKNLPLLSENINDIAFDKRNNKLWIGMNNDGLQYLDLETKKLKKENKLLTIYDIAIDDSIGYAGGIRTSLLIITPTRDLSFTDSTTSRALNTIFVDHQKNVWCGMWDNALHAFGNGTQTPVSYLFDGSSKLNLSGDEIISIGEDVNKVLWCGTKVSGIHFFDLQTKKFLNNIRFDQPIISRINCIYRDDYNRMWIGTERGLYIYDPLQNQFKITRLPVADDISTCMVYDRVITKSGNEYVATLCGLFFKRAGETAYSFKEFYYRQEKLQLTSIFQDSKNRILIGTNKSVFLLDTINIQLQSVYPGKIISAADFYSIVSSRVNLITEYIWKGDTLTIPFFYGHCPFIIDHKRKNIFSMITLDKKPGMVYENLVRRLYVDSKNNLWACGGSQGLSKFVIRDSVDLSKYPFNDSIVHKIPYDTYRWHDKNATDISAINNVYDIVENNDGSYWITTQGSGLIKFFPDNKETPFVSYPGNFKSLQGLTKTADDNLWIISSTGLINHHEKTKRYIRYDKTDGLPEGISGLFFNDHPTELSAGFDGGFISFNPNHLIKDHEKPRVYVTKLWVMDIVSDSLLLSDLNLRYDKNFLKFYVSANCFSNNDQLTYKYFLEGIDDNWRNNQNNPLITYTNLPHGNFTLKIKAINRNGMESEVLAFPIIISPPFYRTTWFYLSMIVLIIAGVYVLYKYRIRQILKLQEVRNKIARDLHDDIGSTLGSIHLYSQIANKKLNGEKSGEVKSILEKIESSSSEIIERTGDVVWAVKASNDTLGNLILRMESYAASLLGAAGIQFNIDYDETIADIKLQMAERRNIFLIYKEAVHNIIKYANCTEVNIAIKKRGDKLQIIISDNGKGFSINGITPYNGNGFKNMKSRAEEIKGVCTVTSQPEKGTSIEIIV